MQQLYIRPPRQAVELLTALEGAGYSAFVVGGCVRDSLLGRLPGDWDLCTSATPDKIKELFAAEKLILTGEKHGTVAVVRDGVPYEITTYRLDGAYTDHRHPSSVEFVGDLRVDLSRRDFTVNAMAYAPGKGIQDPFGGQEDLERGIIRCVGDPEARFAEDALRLLRAVRFAAQLDFALEDDTARAAQRRRDTVQEMAAERIYTELDKLLAAPAAGRVLRQYGGILCGAVPEIEPCMHCTQPGPWHCGSVWEHTAATVGAIDARGQNTRGARILYWAALLHDLAKPQCRTVDEEGRAHFYGHNPRGARQARAILRRLKAPSYLIEGAPELIAVHDAPLPDDEPGILRALGKYGPLFLQRLCVLKRADLDAHARNDAVSRRREAVGVFEEKMTELSKTGCYNLSMLAVGGGDVLEAGIAPGAGVGRALHTLLDGVMDGTLPNERAALLEALQTIKREGKL